MANAARSGDLIFRVDGRPCRIVVFGSTAARSRQEVHAAMETPLHHSDPLKAARSWLWIKAVGSCWLRQSKFKISVLVELMYWGERQKRQRAAISSKSMWGWTAGSWLLVKTAWSPGQWTSWQQDHAALDSVIGGKISEAKTSLFEDLNNSWAIPLAAAILYSKQHRLLGIVLCMTLWAHGFMRQYLSLDAIFVGMFCC